MKQVLLRKGQAVIEEVPPPLCDEDKVLVQVDHSCISIGTEMSSLKTSGLPLWRRALQQPENVKKVMESVKTLGIARTKSLVTGKLSAGSPTGYSASGRVIEVGKNITDLKPNDRVACAGAGYANHAELIAVPRNLVVKIPEQVTFSDAATVTLGAIAMQGLRRANPTLGETFVVLGLGILGQLTVQLLRANGCRVLGIDLDQNRINLAKQLGMPQGFSPATINIIDQVYRETDGVGADGVIITAATASDEVISQAFNMCRKKGRVVLVGDVGLHLQRSDFYTKEIDFLISCSYGPGRYDPNYEEQGHDYPIGYVRWTENRNMLEYLQLLASQQVKVQPLIEAVFPLVAATQAYETLNNATKKPLMVLLSYPQQDLEKSALRVANPLVKSNPSNKIRLALIGAGGFAKGMHLPNLQQLSQLYHLQAVVSRTGPNAVATAKQFGASYSTTDFDEILKDVEVDAVIIATRHHLHADMALTALKAGKHVLLEKPLALTIEDLTHIKEFYETNLATQQPILLTGFNRRFSPFIQAIFNDIQNRSNPMIINYRMNAGYIAPDHWVHGAEGGGRNIGEACHIYDLFTYLTNSEALGCQVQKITPRTHYYRADDNFIATFNFADGSIASLTYTALGAKDYPKEQMELFVDGKVLQLNDYRELKMFGTKSKSLTLKAQNKGQLNELKAFAEGIRNNVWPIPLWQQLQATEMSFTVEKDL